VYSTIITFLPNPDTLPSQIDDAFTAVASYWGVMENYFPLSVLFGILTLGLAIELSILGFKIINWGFNKFRGAG